MLSNAYTGQATFRRQRLLRTLLVLPRPLFRLRAEALPRFLQLRHKGREVDALRSLERSPANVWNELRDERQLVALDVSGDQQGLGLFGFDAALVIGEGVFEDGRKAVDQAIGFLH